MIFQIKTEVLLYTYAYEKHIYSTFGLSSICTTREGSKKYLKQNAAFKKPAQNLPSQEMRVGK